MRGFIRGTSAVFIAGVFATVLLTPVSAQTPFLSPEPSSSAPTNAPQQTAIPLSPPQTRAPSTLAPVQPEVTTPSPTPAPVANTSSNGVPDWVVPAVIIGLILVALLVYLGVRSREAPPPPPGL